MSDEHMQPDNHYTGEYDAGDAYAMSLADAAAAAALHEPVEFDADGVVAAEIVDEPEPVDPDPYVDDEDEPAPRPRTLPERAQDAVEAARAAQDRYGWLNYGADDAGSQFADAGVDLGRVVVELGTLLRDIAKRFEPAPPPAVEPEPEPTPALSTYKVATLIRMEPDVRMPVNLAGGHCAMIGRGLWSWARTIDAPAWWNAGPAAWALLLADVDHGLPGEPVELVRIEVSPQPPAGG